MMKKKFIIGLLFLCFFSYCTMMKKSTYIDENIGTYAIKKIGLITIWEGYKSQNKDFGYNITLTKNIHTRFPGIGVVFNAYPSYSVESIAGDTVRINIKHKKNSSWTKERFEFPGGVDDTLTALISEDLLSKGYQVYNLSRSITTGQNVESMLNQIGIKHGVDVIYVLRYNAYSKFYLQDPIRTCLGLLLECNSSIYSVKTSKLIFKKMVSVNSVEHLGIRRVKVTDIINGTIDQTILVKPLLSVVLKGIEGKIEPLHLGLPYLQ